MTIIPDSSALRVFEPGDWDQSWLLAPFVDEDIFSKRDVFIKALAQGCSMTRQQLEKRLCDSSYVQELLNTHLDVLTAAFKACHGNLNLTSLCLYSGPAEQIGPEHGLDLHHGPWVSNLNQGRIAWLATGDAKLSKDPKCDAFLLHFKDHLEKVSTFTLPHHGSAHDFNDRLLAITRPKFCVVAADAVKDWQHPAANVTRAVATAGAMLLVTNATEGTRVHELAWSHDPKVVAL